jgi:hypothetical protein
VAINAPHDTNGPSTSISLDLDAPECSNSHNESNIQSSSEHQGVTTENSREVNPFAPPEDEPFENVFAPESSNEASSSGESNNAISFHYPQPHEHLKNGQLTKGLNN